MKGPLVDVRSILYKSAIFLVDGMQLMFPYLKDSFMLQYEQILFLLYGQIILLSDIQSSCLDQKSFVRRVQNLDD